MPNYIAIYSINKSAKIITQYELKKKIFRQTMGTSPLNRYDKKAKDKTPQKRRNSRKVL